ncbi:hypothetical protein A3H12_03745 [Candidatus Uhrbacteria bacterium RIFCSPLOWO2_12_FULL_47_9]|nr:MAG: hypothetical protein A3B20_02160 [Candidatus Uhrbacteria bacterium RIFCSPLOWO2_01_FULL_47_17]OGL92751.1 MAG: hypothetical protein A3H12_03745 [Candidatus Uhrbacteria bacterium RIFCSPLOWO2_12_FULL_47_9]
MSYVSSFQNVQPKISVIMPVYNGSRYLCEAIESILKQTYSDFELIIVDDFSTDNTVDLIKEYQAKDKRVHLYKNAFTKGIVGSLNTGLAHASGLYIARADADDVNLPSRFMDQVNMLEQNPDIVLVGAGCRVFSEKGFGKSIYRPSSAVELAWRLISDTYFCHPVTMYRKEIATAFHGYAQKEAEDFDLFSRIIKKHQTRNLHKVLLNYREHSSNRSKEAAQAIAKSVHNIFLDNFEYYFGTTRNADKFFAFQHDGIMHVSDFILITRMNLQIIRKILLDYHISFFSREVFFCTNKIFFLQCRALFSRWISSLKMILRSFYRYLLGKSL